MAAFEDLTAAVTRLNNSVSAEIKAVSDKLAAFGDDVTPAQIATVVADLNGIADKVDAETTVLTAPPA